MSEYKDRQVKGLTVQSDARTKVVNSRFAVFMMVLLLGMNDLRSTE